jgi:hypothetical protein
VIQLSARQRTAMLSFSWADCSRLLGSKPTFRKHEFILVHSNPNPQTKPRKIQSLSMPWHHHDISQITQRAPLTKIAVKKQTNKQKIIINTMKRMSHPKVQPEMPKHL